ncbi:hypothetical protein LSCM1_06108 [Leishmania martiniquensis]|uniref:BAR domain-containing protein n=1 Tax=Leishmania martiniquensis TaxID=1580590 RepID=A0A836GTE2_9TRYP|nr:hypothetical protein LSCM1_06108 [Leishmania martiniquensis]
MGNRVSIITSSREEGRGINSEFQYRCGVLKRLKTSCKDLKRNVADAVAHMESTPQHLRGVGTGYLSLCACLKNGGAGGSSTRCLREAEGGERGPSSRNVIDRQLANESFIGFQSFCDAMDDLKAGVCATFRNDIHERLTNQLEKLLSETEQVLALGKRTKGSMMRFSNATKAVSRYESEAANKGKDLSENKGYAKAVSDRNTKEGSFMADLETFNRRYEEVMVAAQEFCSSTTDIFLDSVVACYREFVTMLDVVETPPWSRFRSAGTEMTLHRMSGVRLSETAAEHRDDNKSSVTTEPKRLD